MLEVLDAPMSSNLQDNLATINQQFGNKFTIKWGDIEMPVVMETIEMRTNGLLPYKIRHAAEPDETRMYIFEIVCIDPVTIDMNNNTYISSVRSHGKISEENVINFVIALLNFLGAESTVLYDAATIQCDSHNIDLSFVKLIEKEETSYSQLGFEYVELRRNGSKYQYKQSGNLEQYQNELVKNIQGITVEHLRDHYIKILHILVDATINQQQNELEIRYITDPTVLPPKTHSNANNDFIIPNLMRECYTMLSILNTDQVNVADLFIKDIKGKCDKSLYLLDYVFESRLYSVKLGDKCVVRNYAIWVNYLRTIRENHRFVYYFNKTD